MKCKHPDEALIKDKPTPFCLACGKNIPMKKTKHKGRVKGSKNKTHKEATIVKRIPISKLPDVLKALGKA